MQLPRFYPIIDTELVSRRGMTPETAAAALLDGGARILQLRHKGHFSREVFGAAERIAQLCSQAGVVFIINDRADVAAMLNAGLHLGQDDLRPADARKLMPPGALIGFSTHNEQQLLAAAGEPVDYLALGPIFGTSSKANPDPLVGLAELRRLRRFTRLPLVAIGGVTHENAGEVWAAGADSVALIGDLFSIGGDAGRLRARAEQWRE